MILYSGHCTDWYYDAVPAPRKVAEIRVISTGEFQSASETKTPPKPKRLRDQRKDVEKMAQDN